MDWTAISKRAWRLAAELAAAILVYRLLRRTGLYAFTSNEADGLNTVILLVGNIYAVMFAFVIFVIWGRFTDVQNFVMRECNSLDDLLRFSAYLKADANHGIRRAVAEYAQRVIQSEWRSLAERKADANTEKSFAGLMNVVMRIVPASQEEATIVGQLVEMLRRAGEHRDERIHKSLTRIPPTLAALVRGMAMVLLLLVYVYPFRRWEAGAACFVLVAVVLFLADLVMTDTDNPFEGVCNIGPEPYSALKV